MISFLKRFIPTLLTTTIFVGWILLRNWGEPLQFFPTEEDFNNVKHIFEFAEYPLKYMPFGADVLLYFIAIAIGGYLALPWGVCLFLTAVVMPIFNIGFIFFSKETPPKLLSLSIFLYIRYIYCSLVILFYHNSIWPSENPIWNAINIAFLGLLFILGLLGPSYLVIQDF